jgi:hypothetical protein
MEEQMAKEPVHPESTGQTLGSPAPFDEMPGSRKLSLSVPVVAGSVFGTLVLAGLFWVVQRPPLAPPEPSEESLEYLSNVTVSDFYLSVADNMVGSVILYLDGMVNNKGDRTVRYLRVRLYFYDTLSQLILRVERDIVTLEGAPLAPGETRDFQLRFDRPPASWNLQPPQFQLVSLEIE